MAAHKVLIAEDEYLTRDELAMFPWENNGLRLVGEAENGEVAWSLFQQHKPEIVITDIMMPVMDGLELARRIKQAEPETAVIMLTFHSDYAYLRQAMIYGVKDYLLKGKYKEEELAAVLGRVRQELAVDHSLMPIDPTLKTWLHASGRTFADKIKDYSFPYPCLAISLHVRHNALVDGKPGEMAYETRFKSLSDLWRGQLHKFSQQEYLLLLPEKALPAEGFLRLFSRSLSGQGEEPFCFWAISDSIRDARTFLSAYNRNMVALKQVFYGNQPALRPVEAGQPLRSFHFEELLSFSAGMRAALTSSQELIHFLVAVFKPRIERARIEPEDVRLLLLQWTAEWERSEIIDRDLIQRESFHFMNLCEIVAYMVDVLEQYAFRSNYVRFEIEKVIRICTERMHEPLSLLEIAEQVGLSPKYLGRQFKQYTGEVFRDFIKKIRMEKAAFLLQHSNLKIYEIAGQIGIANYRYFCEVFQQHFNKTPKEYRGKRHDPL